MKKVIIFLIVMIVLLPLKITAIGESAYSYTLMDMTTNRVLLSKNMNSPRLIASITKIMTCILAIESNRLDEVVVVDESILKSYGSGIYIQVGEEITLRDLLYGLMLRSGNDAAMMIANYISGSEEEFVKKMNNKAKELEMLKTNFVNASGLDDEMGNYSSTYDMALLTSYAMKNNTYRDIVKTKKHTVKTNYKTYIWTNKNKLLQYDYITGGKTGYTIAAGRTLVTTASSDNMNFVVVTIRDGNDWDTHLDLYKYAFDNYTAYKVLNKKKFNVLGDTYYKGTLYVKNNVYIPLKNDEVGNLISYIKLIKKSNYQDEDIVGVNEIYLDKELLYKENIYIYKGERIKKSFFDKLKELFA